MKTNTTDGNSTPFTTTKRAIAPAKPKQIRQTTVKKPTAAKKPTPEKPGVAKSRAPRKSARKPIVKAGFTHEDVALRAYFIAEKRRANGVAGSEHSDWVEAESQLRAERAPME